MKSQFFLLVAAGRQVYFVSLKTLDTNVAVSSAREAILLYLFPCLAFLFVFPIKTQLRRFESECRSGWGLRGLQRMHA